MFINLDTLIPILESYRICWIGGKTGGCKTSLSFQLFNDHFGAQGYRLVTNCLSVWGEDIDKVQLDKTNHAHAFVILDEGGRYLKANTQVEYMMSLMAKMDTILMIPSYWPPCSAAQVLTIDAMFSIRSTGIPLIFYKWNVRLKQFRDKGWFIWLFPQSIYGLYSRQDPADSSTRIVQLLLRLTDDYKRKYGRFDDLEAISTEVSQVDLLRDIVGEISESTDAWTTVASRRNRKR